MKAQWQEYSEKFLQISIREQYLILLTGLVAVFFIIFHLFIDPIIIANNNSAKKITQLTSGNKSLLVSIADMQLALRSDPNKAIRIKISQFETKLNKADAELLKLTSDLINPVQMRYALLDLLKVEKGVSLLSFELLGAQPLLEKNSKSADDVLTEDDKANTQLAVEHSQLNLYRHVIKLKLSGGYFELRDYLLQLEQLQWQFFWQSFNFEVQEYPESELEIIIYSLSTKQEFVGV